MLEKDKKKGEKILFLFFLLQPCNYGKENRSWIFCKIEEKQSKRIEKKKKVGAERKVTERKKREKKATERKKSEKNSYFNCFELVLCF